MQLIVLCLHVLRFSFHSQHKLLDAAHIYLGLTFKHCYMLEQLINLIKNLMKYKHFDITYKNKLF